MQSKVKGIHTNITSICEALKKTTQDCDRNSINISVVKPSDEIPNKVSDLVDSSFMYTQLLKEIILTIDFEPKHINEFLMYCRQQSSELKHIDMIEKDYRPQQAIWWYTYSRLLYTMLNRALRLMEVDLIIKMGFFVRDLHNHIAELHLQQYSGCSDKKSFVVYRGQGLSLKDFDDLKNAQGGLLSFNNFLSTSLDQQVSLAFAESNQGDPNLIGILFQITIDPSIPSSIFANVKNFGYFKEEEEILFSMHSIFRIQLVKKIDGYNRLWQVNLTLAHENNSQLHILTERLREETFPQTKGWYRLGILLVILGQFDKAEQVYQVMSNQTMDQGSKANIYVMLGRIKNGQGHYVEAIELYEKALEIQRNLSENHLSIAAFYNNIGLVYRNMGEYSKALEYYKKMLEIDRKTLPENHYSPATSYHNIGVLYFDMNEYTEALSYYQTALEINRTTLPANHPDLATSYNSIAMVFFNMGNHLTALSYHEKGLDIYQKTLPSNHPLLASSYNNIGLIYFDMGEYLKALSYYQKGIDMQQNFLSTNHPLLATLYNNIANVYHNMGKYLEALIYSEEALKIEKKTPPANHSSMAISYNNIGSRYKSLGMYPQAFSHYEKAFEIQEKTLPVDHFDFAQTYNNIAFVYDNMKEYSKTLEYFQHALRILEKSRSPDNSHIKAVKENIEHVQQKLRAGSQ